MLPKSKNFAAKAAFATFQPPCARSYVKHNAEHSRDKPRTTEIAILLQFRAIDAHDPT